jgi:hypothetical protein
MQLIRVIRMEAEAYKNGNFQHQITPPVRCPHCAAEKSCAALGYYGRNVTHGLRKILRIFIRRFRCRSCKKTVSILPSFAQPYRLVENETIDQFFSGGPWDRVVPWQGLLNKYWNRFTNWIPEIEKILGPVAERSPPQGAAMEWWQVLAERFGDVNETTRHLVSVHRITLFGKYSCHQPGR